MSNLEDRHRNISQCFDEKCQLLKTVIEMENVMAEGIVLQRSCTIEIVPIYHLTYICCKVVVERLILSVQTRNARVVGLNPSSFTAKTILTRKSTGSHLTKTHLPGEKLLKAFVSATLEIEHAIQPWILLKIPASLMCCYLRS